MCQRWERGCGHGKRMTLGRDLDSGSRLCHKFILRCWVTCLTPFGFEDSASVWEVGVGGLCGPFQLQVITRIYIRQALRPCSKLLRDEDHNQIFHTLAKHTDPKHSNSPSQLSQNSSESQEMRKRSFPEAAEGPHSTVGQNHTSNLRTWGHKL